jgi:integrase
MSKRKFPITVRNGSVAVKIYRTPSHGCESFTVAYYQGGRRQRRTFPTLQKAQDEATVLANQMAAGELDALTLTNSDRSAYVRSLELLKPFGTPLEMAVMQFAEAARILDGGSLVEAAKFYARHHHRKLVSRAVPDVVKEFLAAKEQDGASAVYLKDLRTRLIPFGEAFHSPISMVLAPEIEDYLRDLKAGPRSKNNTRKVVKILFNFAQRRGYLPKGLTEAHDTTRLKEPTQPIGIFTPAEMAKLLAHADEEVLPFLAIGAFAGLRHAEVLRLDWSEIDLAGGYIEVKANKAKTASRRLVPILDNLKAWLAPRHQGSGKVVPMLSGTLTQRLGALAKAAKVKWQHNGLRHSFISYRVAKVQNVAQVALEAGNSPKIIFTNYRELVKLAEAEKWFSLLPETPANVVPAPVPAAVA